MTEFNHIKNEDKAVPISTGSTFFVSSDELPKLADAANNGDLDAAVRLYKHFRFSKLDTENAINWLQKAAELGDKVSQYNLAYYYLQNDNIELARHWALTAMANGVTEASELLEEINGNQ